jgi:glutathionylspermidine synthase
MKRIKIAERPNWKESAENLGFKFHTIDGEAYWDESAYYQFTMKQIEHDLEDPTQELHDMCMDLAEKVVNSEELMTRLAIPAQFHDLVRTSWREGHPHLYGRMDFSYNGKGPAKLLELNYDTPTSLYESSAFQWLWLEEQIRRGVFPANTDQYNSIEDKMSQAFAHMKTALGFNQPFYFSSTQHSDEDKATVEYMRDIAMQAGHETKFINLEDIGLNEKGCFVDLDDNHIPYIFKLHAWEHIFLEKNGPAVQNSRTAFIEPAWKSILSNKGILPLLWAEHEGHPNLLPTYFENDPTSKLDRGWVRKPFFSREGANIEVCEPSGKRHRVDGPYTDAPYIRQRYHKLPQFEGSYTLIGSWVIGDRAAGIGIREDSTVITKDTSRFLPHVIID